MAEFTLPSIAAQLVWTNFPSAWAVEDGTLRILASGTTDLFVDPAGMSVTDNAPRLTFTPDPVFSLSTHAKVQFKATYDAAVLVLYADVLHWAKLCFEYSPRGEPMIVSVVTNGVSDDCNSVTLGRDDVYLRASCLGRAFAFHYSEDGVTWRLVRHFALQQTEGLGAGFLAQSPTGNGCAATFREISYAAKAVENIRSGE